MKLRLVTIVVVTSTLCARLAGAQGGLGSGPLTGSLATQEPSSGVIKWGPVAVAPGITIREAGHDDNVFNEAVDQNEDWYINGTPDVSVFTRLPFVQLSGYAGSDMQFYKTYDSENNVGYSFSGRLDFLGSRLLPFIGGGRTSSRRRPNGEIDTRTDLLTDELSGGIGYLVSSQSQIFVAVIQSGVDYRDAFQSGVSLDLSLTRTTTEYQAGLKTNLTPLLSMQLRGSYRKDEFTYSPERDGDARMATAVFTFDPSAVVSGSVTLGYQDYQAVDPLIRSYRGFVGSGSITYPVIDIGRLNFNYNRATEYSFEEADGYYVENTVGVSYTQRLIGQIDFQGLASHSSFDYGQRTGGSDRTDSLELYNGNLGYNLRNRTRVAMNYEYARRRSPEIAERNYIRRRIYLSWMVGF